MAGFIREKTIYCGDEIKEIDIIPFTDGQAAYNKSGSSRKRISVTAPKQKNLNDKNARRYLTQLLNANFSEEGSGYHITLTYDERSLPKTVDEADAIVDNYIRRLKTAYKNAGLPLKSVIITSYRAKKDGTPVRIHHHIVMNSGVDPNIIRNQWRKPLEKGDLKKIKNESWYIKYGIRRGERYGIVNVDVLQPDENGITALAEYLKKQPREACKRRWRASHNLRKPETVTPNDEKYSKRQIEKIVKQPFDVSFWERKYKGWTVARPYEYSYRQEYHEATGWSIYLVLRRKRGKGNEKE